MINVSSFKALLRSLGFTADASGNIFSKRFSDVAGGLFACEMKANFAKEELVYPEDNGLKVNERQTCNTRVPENFVVFECVHRLLAQCYQPAHIELEHPIKVGHGASGGRTDIWVKDNEGKSLLIIECKTAGKESDNEEFLKTLPRMHPVSPPPTAVKDRFLVWKEPAATNPTVSRQSLRKSN